MFLAGRDVDVGGSEAAVGLSVFWGRLGLEPGICRRLEVECESVRDAWAPGRTGCSSIEEGGCWGSRRRRAGPSAV